MCALLDTSECGSCCTLQVLVLVLMFVAACPVEMGSEVLGMIYSKSESERQLCSCNQTLFNDHAMCGMNETRCASALTAPGA
jgi:hypothetical protein